MKSIIRRALAVLVLLPCAALAEQSVQSALLQAQDQEKPYDPTDRYEPRQIEGWRVLVNKRLSAEKPELCRQALAQLGHQLYQITRKVPREALGKLRKVTIWVEADEPHHRCMTYHPDAGWLRNHGMNPEKAGCIEIADAENFLAWTRDQPWMVLHELAHAYHHQFLGGYESPEILAAYRRMTDSGSYQSVLHIGGKTRRAYAAVNQMEYFAETSEAFFGTNDFYPFVRAELQEHDPRMYKLLEKLWGRKHADAK